MRFLRAGRTVSTSMSATGLTDVGVVRSSNQDNFAVRLGKDAPVGEALLAVADGMGGHAAGEIASQMSLDLFIDALSTSPAPTERSLRAAAEQANDGVYKASFLGPNMRGMGTTLVAGMLVGGVLHICNVGDSRAYLLREGRLAQLTRDHSWVGDMVARGLLTPEQASVHPRRNVLTRALGVGGDVQVDVTRAFLRQGDRILLCSDGLYGLVDESTIAAILNRRSLRAASRDLVRLANRAGGTDNITVVVAQMDLAVEAVESATIADNPEDTLTPGSRPPLHTGFGLREAAIAANDAGVSAGPPWRGRLPLIAAGGFGAIIVIVFLMFVVSQSGEDDGRSGRPSLTTPPENGASTPPHSPIPNGAEASVAAPVQAIAPSATPEPSPTAAATPTGSSTATSTRGDALQPASMPAPEPTPTVAPMPANTPAAKSRHSEAPQPTGSSAATSTTTAKTISTSTPAATSTTSDADQTTATSSATSTASDGQTSTSTPAATSTTSDVDQTRATSSVTSTTSAIPTPTVKPTPTPAVRCWG